MRVLLRATAIALALVLTTAVAAQDRLRIDVGEAELLRLSSPAEAVFVADPEVADVEVSGSSTIIVFGVATGTTRLFALDEAGAPIVSRQIRVQHNLSELESAIRERFPGNEVRLTSAPRSVMIEGRARTPEDAEAIRSTVRGTLGDGEELIDRLAVDMPTQVNLRVRVVEVSRSVDRTFDIDFSSLFSVGDVTFQVASRLLRADIPEQTDYRVSAIIEALDEQGLARTLAEPNLTALSGETATFLAGGEFPVPVAQEEDTITIDFRSFGISLAFTPTVLGRDRINLVVRPEVSRLSEDGAITTADGLRIPALTVRRVETSVELGSGQSLAIGGLLQESTRDLIQKFPGLGDVPVLGTLFTSSEYQNEQSELIVLVTPYVVEANRPDAFASPLGRQAPTTPLEALILDREGEPADGARRLHGPVGFIY
ncbi:MAG: type II and III secretion system protein family protein [Alphaproteobacteria bacterium]